VLGEVVRGTDAVAFGVRQLALDDLMVPAVFVQQGGQAAKDDAGVVGLPGFIETRG